MNQPMTMELRRQKEREEEPGQDLNPLSPSQTDLVVSSRGVAVIRQPLHCFFQDEIEDGVFSKVKCDKEEGDTGYH